MAGEGGAHAGGGRERGRKEGKGVGQHISAGDGLEVAVVEVEVEVEECARATPRELAVPGKSSTCAAAAGAAEAGGTGEVVPGKSEAARPPRQERFCAKHKRAGDVNLRNKRCRCPPPQTCYATNGDA